MIEALKVIAMLCQISSSSSHFYAIENAQIKCQKYYAECALDYKSQFMESHLVNCIKNKK